MKRTCSHCSFFYLSISCTQIWVQPEGPKQFASIFLSICTTFFVICDLDWTLFVVEAAPLLKNLYILVSRCIYFVFRFPSCNKDPLFNFKITLLASLHLSAHCNLDLSLLLLFFLSIWCMEICRHICDINERKDTAERTNVPWQTSDFKHKNLSLLQVQGFVVEKKVMRYVRLVIQHSASLKRIRLLKQAPCEKCAAFNRRCILPETKWRFPEQKRDKVWCRDGLMEGQWSSAEIFIEEWHEPSIEHRGYQIQIIFTRFPIKYS